MRQLPLITLAVLLAVPLVAQTTSRPAARHRHVSAPGAAAPGVGAPAERGPARPSAAHLRADLSELLARPEYRPRNNQWLVALAYRLARAFHAWYQEILSPRLASLYNASPVLYLAAFGLGVVLVTVLLYHIFITLRSAFGAASPSPRRRRSAGAAVPAAPPETLLAEAEAAAAAGDFAEALRRLYLALIRNLDRAGLLRYDRSRTNQEYLRQVRASAAIGGPLAALTQEAESVWYGGRRLRDDDYRRCRALALAAWQKEPADAAP